MSELTERLRNRYCAECESIKGHGTQNDCTTAADRIDALEETLTDLTASLSLIRDICHEPFMDDEKKLREIGLEVDA